MKSNEDFLAFESRAVIMPTEVSRVLNIMEVLKDTCQNVTKIRLYIIYANVKFSNGQSVTRTFKEVGCEG